MDIHDQTEMKPGRLQRNHSAKSQAHTGQSADDAGSRP